MKKISALLLALVLCLTSVAALADTYGLGLVTGVSGKDASVVDGENYDGSFGVDTTICALVLDDAGIIKSIKFDVQQTKLAFSPEAKVTTDVTAEFPSKLEKGEAYGMRAASPIGKEWFEQVAALEAFCIGKTPADVLATPTYQKDENHTAVPEDADLKAGVTMTIGDFLAALEKAAASAK